MSSKLYFTYSSGGSSVHLNNFSRGLKEEHFCEINLNLTKWFRRCLLKKKFTDDRHHMFIWN